MWKAIWRENVFSLRKCQKGPQCLLIHGSYQKEWTKASRRVRPVACLPWIPPMKMYLHGQWTGGRGGYFAKSNILFVISTENCRFFLSWKYALRRAKISFAAWTYCWGPVGPHVGPLGGDTRKLLVHVGAAQWSVRCCWRKRTCQHWRRSAEQSKTRLLRIWGRKLPKFHCFHLLRPSYRDSFLHVTKPINQPDRTTRKKMGELTAGVNEWRADHNGRADRGRNLQN